ncbi:ZinT family metal-binding protein [Terribacillus saccharophilus]|uniref:ZinT domain-containing protein n=1 Tax=Terribacillus saccharophilus TaxID=361277 RepID=A0A268AAD9_9BACI|nr:hypothetical protein CHH64_10765 [Terribacillus saccharophilus]PAF38310.1 hypothetical protein CHH58_02425 [Terribacillus saccharophilus]
MNLKKLSIFISLLVLSVILVACQSTEEETATNNKASETEKKEVNESGEITIEGLGEHYHTGDTIELTAVPSEDVDYDHWHWFTKESDQTDWKEASGQQSETFTGEATADGLEIKATLYDDNHEVYAESEPVTIMIDDHHGHDEESKKISEGFFEDEQVEDRELSDWEGDWQSVYPYLLDGDLDEVFEHKAVEGDMTAAEYKEYYTTGYKTDVERIIIDNGNVTFFRDGQQFQGDYEYDGYEILTYEAGNRGVRFIYKLVDENDDMPQYIQFSDHLISPTESHHYHLYWGDNREKLLEEVTHWPTYYPSNLDADDIVRDQLAH